MTLNVFQKDLFKKFYKSTAQIYRQPQGVLSLIRVESERKCSVEVRVWSLCLGQDTRQGRFQHPRVTLPANGTHPL